jgi:hypothetical protein
MQFGARRAQFETQRARNHLSLGLFKKSKKITAKVAKSLRKGRKILISRRFFFAYFAQKRCVSAVKRLFEQPQG